MSESGQLETLERVADTLATSLFVVEVLKDGRARYLMANRLHERASGIPRERLVGREPHEILAPETVQQVLQRYRTCARQRTTVEYDYSLTNGGETTWWHTVLTPWGEEDNDRQILIGSSLDVTPQKRAEEEMQKSRDRLHLAISGADMGLWDWDLGSGHVYYSSTWQGILGEPAALPPRIGAWLDRIHPEDAEQAREMLAAHLACPDAPFLCDHRLRHHDGSWVWVSMRGRALCDSTRRPYRMAGIIHNIAKRKRAEAAKEESDRRFRSLLEGSLQGILIHRAYRPLFANEAFARIYGYASVEAVMREESLLHLIDPDQRVAAMRQWEKALADPEHHVKLEQRNLTRDGDEVWVEIMGRRVDWMGAPAVQLTIIDITERKQFEMQLLESRDALERQANELARLAQDLDSARRQAVRHGSEAEAASRAKSQFLATMSHELRTPLNAILGFAEIISEETFGSVGVPAYKDYAKDILTSGRHLLDLINDILDLAKIEAGRLGISPEYLHLEEVLEGCLRLSRMRAAERGIELELQIAPGAEQLHADERAMKQIVFNLLSNAIKFTPSGGRIVLSAERNDNGEVAIEVSDTGIGIAAKDLERVLQPFEQVDNSYNRGANGTGLGLALVNSLSALHGGRLEIESAIGSGTRVRVTFPDERRDPLRAAS